MIYNYELENLDENELALLWRIVTKNGANEDLWSCVTSYRKESLLQYIYKNQTNFTSKGREICESLVKKLLNIELK